MKSLVLIIGGLLFAASSSAAQTAVFLSELHYDNSGADIGKLMLSVCFASFIRSHDYQASTRPRDAVQLSPVPPTSTERDVLLYSQLLRALRRKSRATAEGGSTKHRLGRRSLQEHSNLLPLQPDLLPRWCHPSSSLFMRNPVVRSAHKPPRIICVLSPVS